MIEKIIGGFLSLLCMGDNVEVKVHYRLPTEICELLKKYGKHLLEKNSNLASYGREHKGS